MPKISLSGPAELLTVIPFHLGFQPARSVVVVCFHGIRLGLVARLDVVGPDLATEAAAQTVPTLLQGDPSSVALVGFEEEADESLPLLEAITDAVEGERVLVRERLVVRDGRWRSVGCDCCPDEGWLLPEQADVPAVADYVALGHAVLPAREDLARLVDPLTPTHPLHDLLDARIVDWQRRFAVADGPEPDRLEDPRPRRGFRGRPGRAARALAVLEGGEPSPRRLLLDEAVVAWAAVLHGDVDESELHHWVPSFVGPLRDLHVRDALVGWLCPGSVRLDDFPEELVVLLDELLGPELRVAPAAGDEGARAPAWVGDPRDGSTQDSEDSWDDSWADPGEGFRNDSRGESWDGPLDGDARIHDSIDDAELLELLEALSLLDGLDRVGEAGGADGAGGCAVASEEPGGWQEAGRPRLLLARLEQVCRATPGAHAAPLLAVLAALAWWSGDGARSGVAADLALELEPDHRLSRLVRQSLDQGVRPRRCA